MHKEFHVFTGPTVADPAYQVPVTEHQHLNTAEGEIIKIVRYNNADELLRVAHEVKDEIFRQQIRRDTIAEVLGDLGVTQTEWLRRKAGD